jgi:hypothetical protein
MKLVYKNSGKAVRVGDVVKDFRGDKLTVTSVSEALAPKHSGSTGRVEVKSDGWTQCFYPSCINAEWK